jgi:N utilization substance protein A
MNKEFLDALDELEREKNISKDEIIETIESAVELAYKKSYGNYSNVRAHVDRESGEMMVLMSKEVVEEVEDDMIEVSIEEAKSYDPRYEIGDVIEYQVDPKDFGRIAAQTAKQVVVQRIREAERQNSYSEFVDKQGEIITAKIDRINNGTIFLSVGNTEGILPISEQVKSESFAVGDRIKVYVMDVKRTTKGPQIFFSRSHPGLVRRLFELEIPEIADGVVEIKGIAREAGSRTKIAVWSNDDNVDPVGACVGNRGSRVQRIVDELYGEKIDIIVWDDDPAVLISNVLRPAVVEGVYINENEKMATAVVPEQQLSLAIGREGQNVRLAARVSGWKIDIKSRAQLEEMGFDFDEYEDEDEESSASETGDVQEEPEEPAEEDAAEAEETAGTADPGAEESEEAGKAETEEAAGADAVEDASADGEDD